MEVDNVTDAFFQQEHDANGDGHEQESAGPLSICMDLALAISILINALLLITVFTSRKLRTAASTPLIASLTLSDMLQLIVYRSLMEVIHWHNDNEIGENACKAGAYFDFMFNASAIFSLIAIAYERFVAVCRPLRLQKRLGTAVQQGVIRAVCCWLVAIVIAIPQIWMNELVEIPCPDDEFGQHNGGNETLSPNMDVVTAQQTDADSENLLHVDNMTMYNDTSSHQCEPYRSCDLAGPENWAWLKMSQPALAFVLLYVLPTVLITVWYGATSYTLFTTGRNLVSQRGNNVCGRQESVRRATAELRQQEKRHHAAKSMIALVVINVLIMFPMNMTLLIYDYELIDRNELHVFAYVALFSYFINCAVNAVLVCILSNQTRRQLFYVIMFIVMCGRKKPLERFDPESSDRNTLTKQRSTQASNLQIVRMNTWATNKSSSTDDPASDSTFCKQGSRALS